MRALLEPHLQMCPSVRNTHNQLHAPRHRARIAAVTLPLAHPDRRRTIEHLAALHTVALLTFEPIPPVGS